MFDSTGVEAPGTAPVVRPAAPWRDADLYGPPGLAEIELIAEINAELAAAVEAAANSVDEEGLEGAAGSCPDAVALSALAPGPGLAWVLANTDAEKVDDFALVEVIAAWARMTAWTQAAMAGAAAELAHRAAAYERPTIRPPERVRGRPVGARASSAAHEIAMRLCVSRAAAQAIIDRGAAFETALMAVGDALGRGQIDLPRARAFVDALAHVPAPTAVAVVEAVLPGASRRTAAQVTKDIAAALITVEPIEATARHRRARAGRRVHHPTALPDGMAGLYAVLPAVDLIALDLALDAAARTARAAGDPRTSDQLRADALGAVGHHALATGWLGSAHAPSAAAGRSETAGPGPAGPGGPAGPWAGASGPAGPWAGGPPPAPGDDRGGDGAGARPGREEPAGSTATREDDHAGPGLVVDGRIAAGLRLGGVGGRRPRIHVTVPLAVLLGDDSPCPRPLDAAGASAASDPASEGSRRAEVAVLDRYGPISPDVARALAVTGTWQRLVTDPLSGVVLDVGRRRYTPPPDLADLVRARDRYCVRPGCGAPARACDLDHTVPYHHGGRTAHDNLGALCATDHALKTRGVYRVEQPRPGVFDFHLPSGHSYRREPDGSTTILDRGGGHPPSPGARIPDRAPGAGRTDTGLRGADHRPPF